MKRSIPSKRKRASIELKAEKDIEWIKKEIRESGLTQMEIADRCLVNQSNISRFLSGHKTLKLTTAIKLFNILGIQLKKESSED